MCKQITGNNKKCRQIAGNFDHHANAAVRCGAHRPMEHIQSFTRSHWMLPSSECLRCIAPAAVMVDGFIEKSQNTNKKLFSASNLRYNQPLVVCESLIPQNGPSTHLIGVTSCVKMYDAAIVAKEVSYILSYQTLSTDKNSKSY
jgi:hypothetical protein